MVHSVEIIDPIHISSADVTAAGYETPDEIRAHLVSGGDRHVYRVGFSHIDEPDPRDELANNTSLTPGDVEEISKRLHRLDRSSKHGPWTAQTLALISEYPAVRAPDLALSVGRETAPFKLDVRKLKNLGLTLSLKRGYKLSPRGQAYLDAQTEP